MAIEDPAKRSESADTSLAHPVSADLSDLATVLLGHNIVDLVPTVTELSPLAEWNIVSRFDSPSSARAAIVRLERHGIDGSKISYLVLEPPAADHHRRDRQADKK